MTRQLRAVAVLLFAVTMLSGCGSPPAATVTPTPRSAATPTPTVAAPSPSPVPAGPYAVVTTNSSRQGATYDVMLVDVQGQVVAKVTAKLPLLKPNQTVQLPLVSASDDLVYYLDGDTQIHSLSPAGTTALVKTITQGSTSILGFAVSLDDKRIAVTLINQSSDIAKNSGHGYVENLGDGANRVDLFSNTGADAIRWPAGWHGTEVVDGTGGVCGGYGNGPSNAGRCAASYHVISSATGARTATVCEPPSAPPPNESVYVSPDGLPVAAGTACVENEYYYNGSSTLPSGKILAVDWSGHETTVMTADSTGQLAYGNCFLAPGGAQMACTANTSQALTLLAPGASPRNLGRRYNVLGWIDTTHLLVDIDTTTLAVLEPATGATVALTLTGADKATMAGTEPGAF